MVRNSTIFSVRTKRGTCTRVRERDGREREIETGERESEREGETRGNDLHERQGAAAVVQLGVVGGGQHHAQHRRQGHEERRQGLYT